VLLWTTERISIVCASAERCRLEAQLKGVLSSQERAEIGCSFDRGSAKGKM
jgi:hypothetical protein